MAGGGGEVRAYKKKHLGGMNENARGDKKNFGEGLEKGARVGYHHKLVAKRKCFLALS